MLRFAARAARSLVVPALALAACGDRPGDGRSATRVPTGAFGISADSAAVMFGADTLFTQQRALATMGVDPAGRLVRAVLSPDSSMVAFATRGPVAQVGVWSRIFQSASRAGAIEGAEIDSITWSPSGRFVAYQARRAEGRSALGVFDAGLGERVRHAAVDWLARTGGGVAFQAWDDTDWLRARVSPNGESSAEQAFVWDAENGVFASEAHVERISEFAPRGAALERDGVFSIDLTGDNAFETVVLYRLPDASLSALVIEPRGGGLRASTTEPLVTLDALRFPSWDEAVGDVRLHLVEELGGAPLILLQLPSSERPLGAVGLFRVAADGRLRILEARTRAGSTPAVFYDGQFGDRSSQLGLVDLDNDGEIEVVSATGRVVGEPPNQGVRWRANVFRWDGERLVQAPELAGAALERIESAMAGRAER